MTSLLAISFGLKIFLLIAFLLLAIAVCFFLLVGIRKDHKRYKYSRYQLKDLERREFDVLIKERIEGETPKACSIVFVQFSGAKEYRDRHGDDVYAWVMGAIRERAASIFPRSGKVCLYEYDTYAFLLEGERTDDQLNEYLTQCIAKAHLPIPYGLRKKAELPDLILGAASFYPDDKCTAKELLRNVEIALAVSGRGGANNFEIFSPDLLANNSDYHYYRELKDAINANELSLRFQPIRNLLNGDTLAYETTLHWEHGESGEIQPDKLVHVLERTDDLHWVGLWAYEQMLVAYKKYLNLHPASKIIFSINLSMGQLSDPSISEELYKITAKYGVQPYCVCFEVAEGALLGRNLAVRENLEKLSQCGYLLAIDNFVVDEKSVEQVILRKMYHWVKLDKRFTADVESGDPDIKDIHALLEFSREEKVAIIAQGIKNGLTEVFLKRIGIFCGQGNCLGKAEPIENYLGSTETTVVFKKSESQEEEHAAPKTAAGAEPKAPENAQPKASENTEQKDRDSAEGKADEHTEPKKPDEPKPAEPKEKDPVEEKKEQTSEKAEKKKDAKASKPDKAQDNGDEG